MKKLPASVSSLLILALGTALTIAVIVGRPKVQPSDIETKQPPFVEVITANPVEQPLMVYSQASIQSSQRIQLNARVAGTIWRVGQNFIVGATLNRGDLLVSLDDIEYRNALSQAQLTLAQAKQQQANELALATEAEGRWRDLGSRSANDLFLRKPQLATAKAQLSAAKVGLELAQTNLQRTQVRAPFDGRIAKVHANIGQFVNAGTAIVEIYSTESLQLLVPLTKRQLEFLQLDNYRANSDIQVVISDRQRSDNYQWQARLIGVDGNVNVNTRLFNAVVEVSNRTSPYLVPGLFVDVGFQSAVNYAQVTLPLKALVDGQFVYIVSDQQLHKKPVQLLATDDQSIIVSGLEIGDKVVVSRPLWTVEGSAVQLRSVQH